MDGRKDRNWSHYYMLPFCESNEVWTEITVVGLFVSENGFLWKPIRCTMKIIYGPKFGLSLYK
jgi:hypothetical protein